VMSLRDMTSLTDKSVTTGMHLSLNIYIFLYYIQR
jgi:hypothetical protein